MCAHQSDIYDTVRKNIESLAVNGLKRTRRAHHTAQGPEISIDGKTLINFCNNDYLGLANHPAVVAAIKEGVDRYGAGSGASQLICGYTTAHKQLEEHLCEFTGRQRAIIFSSGYLANLAIASTLLDKNSTLFGDRLNHASMIDAARLSRAKFKRYQHANPGSLQTLIYSQGPGKKLVMTDGVFSMDGDIAPVPELAKICKESRALLVVDDAHGFGVLGESGGGTIQHCQLKQDHVPMLMATFGKALGTAGAFLAGDEEIIEQFIQSARTLVYTTALPPALAFATSRSLCLMQEEHWRRQHLRSLTERFKAGARQMSLPIMESVTPIQPLLIGSAKKATQISGRLFDKGIYVAAVRPPTVPEGTSRLRITLTAAHTGEQVDQLLSALSELV